MLEGVKARLSWVFRIFTIILLGLTILTAANNVFSDDTAVKALAGDMARKEAGCGDKCKLTNMRGSRGMIDEQIDYDFDRAGSFVVVCRRASIIIGDYACTVTKR
jgi:hypothetical protein